MTRPQQHHHKIDPIANAEFLKYLREVSFHRTQSDSETLGDLSVARSLRHELCHFTLTTG